MFEKFKAFIEESASMLEDSFSEPDDFVTVPEGVTAEQLIEESKQYVDAIIVPAHGKAHKTDSPSVFLKTGDQDKVPDPEVKEPESETPDSGNNDNNESISAANDISGDKDKQKQ